MKRRWLPPALLDHRANDQPLSGPKLTDQQGLELASRAAQRAFPACRPNPPVGAVLVRNGIILGRGWTQPGGRPHAEAAALAAAAGQSRSEVANEHAGQSEQVNHPAANLAGATLYVTLEPCAHASKRGPSCSNLIAASGIARLVYGEQDPDPRTAGKGAALVAATGIEVVHLPTLAARASLEGYLSQQFRCRPHITLKLAMSIDGAIALADGSSQWITGEEARAQVQLLRAQCDAILVGRGTYEADQPRLDVRIAGLEGCSPSRFVLSSRTGFSPPEGWQLLSSADDLAPLAACQRLLIEGGAGAASAFLARDLVDRLVIFTAPIIIGGNARRIGDIGLAQLSDAHDKWRSAASRMIGKDHMAVYERMRSAD